MNNYKKILLVFKSLGILGIISTIFAFSLLWMFAINFWGTFILCSMIQIIFPFIYEKYVLYRSVQDTLDEYRQKPYKKYNIPLTCQYCGREEGVDIDLEDTTYNCANCKRPNAIYVTFTTAVISDAPQPTVSL